MFSKDQIETMNAKAESLLGTPFKLYAREGSGFIDCYGLVLSIYGSVGIHLPDFTDDIGEDAKTLFEETESWVAGDVIEYSREDFPRSHVALIIKKPGSIEYVYHVGEAKGVCCLPLRKMSRVFGGCDQKFFRYVGE